MNIIPSDGKMLCPKTGKRVLIEKHKLTKRGSGG